MQTADYIRLLPDVYSKASVFLFYTSSSKAFHTADGYELSCAGGNNWKLLSLESDFVSKFRDDVGRVLESINIYTATGKTLDLFGNMLGQYRNGANDEQYRYLILGKANQNLCKGDYNSIVENLARIFDCENTAFSLVESEEACTVTMTAFPLEIIIHAGLTTSQMTEIISNLLPAGVRLANFELAGTFAFGEEGEYDESTGFADDSQTIGGYLGAMASE